MGLNGWTVQSLSPLNSNHLLKNMELNSLSKSGLRTDKYGCYLVTQDLFVCYMPWTCEQSHGFADPLSTDRGFLLNQCLKISQKRVNMGKPSKYCSSYFRLCFMLFSYGKWWESPMDLGKKTFSDHMTSPWPGPQAAVEPLKAIWQKCRLDFRCSPTLFW